MVRTLIVAVLAMGFVALSGGESAAQLSLEARGKVGFNSASPDTSRLAGRGDPVFNVGGGLQAAALLKFTGGIAAGLDLNWNYEAHQMTGGSATSVMTYNIPSFGITARTKIGYGIDFGGWLNYAFGGACVETLEFPTLEWSAQGVDAGLYALLNYQIKPYMTYVQFGLYGHFQYLTMVRETQEVGQGDLTSTNFSLGVTVGMRFDISL